MPRGRKRKQNISGLRNQPQPQPVQDEGGAPEVDVSSEIEVAAIPEEEQVGTMRYETSGLDVAPEGEMDERSDADPTESATEDLAAISDTQLDSQGSLRPQKGMRNPEGGYRTGPDYASKSSRTQYRHAREIARQKTLFGDMVIPARLRNSELSQGAQGSQSVSRPASYRAVGGLRRRSSSPPTARPRKVKVVKPDVRRISESDASE